MPSIYKNHPINIQRSDTAIARRVHADGKACHWCGSLLLRSSYLCSQECGKVAAQNAEKPQQVQQAILNLIGLIFFPAAPAFLYLLLPLLKSRLVLCRSRCHFSHLPLSFYLSSIILHGLNPTFFLTLTIAPLEQSRRGTPNTWGAPSVSL